MPDFDDDKKWRLDVYVNGKELQSHQIEKPKNVDFKRALQYVQPGVNSNIKRVGALERHYGSELMKSIQIKLVNNTGMRNTKHKISELTNMQLGTRKHHGHDVNGY